MSFNTVHRPKKELRRGKGLLNMKVLPGKGKKSAEDFEVYRLFSLVSGGNKGEKGQRTNRFEAVV